MTDDSLPEPDIPFRPKQFLSCEQLNHAQEYLKRTTPEERTDHRHILDELRTLLNIDDRGYFTVLDALETYHAVLPFLKRFGEDLGLAYGAAAYHEYRFYLEGGYESRFPNQSLSAKENEAKRRLRIEELRREHERRQRGEPNSPPPSSDAPPF